MQNKRGSIDRKLIPFDLWASDG